MEWVKQGQILPLPCLDLLYRGYGSGYPVFEGAT